MFLLKNEKKKRGDDIVAPLRVVTEAVCYAALVV